jgi:SAM-dependent methyltransferase
MTVTSRAPSLGGFSEVDAEADAAGLLAALDEQAAFPSVQRLRATAIDHLAPRLGHHLVDVGCGTGDVARSFAALVGTRGRVVGIDPSETMLAEARRRSSHGELPVEFVHGRIEALDLETECFDGTYCERVFQHLVEPETAMAELARITRSGGRIVVMDSDWGMHAIHGADPDITTRVLDCWARNARNGWSGRRLPALLADAGVACPTVFAETFVTTDPRRMATAPITTMARVAHDSGELTGRG